MKSYGSDYEPSNVRHSRPDAADIRELGLSSRHGKSRSVSKRAPRRHWKGCARRAAKAEIETALDTLAA